MLLDVKRGFKLKFHTSMLTTCTFSQTPASPQSFNFLHLKSDLDSLNFVPVRGTALAIDCEGERRTVSTAK